ncbi:unnamed protein product, partial [Prunus brigantina]
MTKIIQPGVAPCSWHSTPKTKKVSSMAPSRSLYMVLPQLSKWTRCNNLVKSWLLNSISPDIGASIIYNDVASDIWNDLKERFSHANSVHLFHIEQEIHDCVQGSMTIGAYYTKLKGLWDARDALCSLPSCNCGAAKEMFQF